MSEELLENIDDARESTTSRSEWVREAIRDRLNTEEDR
ncbi:MULTISPECIES: ribbon-helix-helix domain-containing protein [Halomicrobium]|nr:MULTISPECIES: ribbon-helix-helix domain-containing protein [Halomicrobium]